MTGVLYVIHIIVAVLLIIVILLQRGKGTELGAAFGGASQTVFGGASGRESFLVRVTIVLGVIFMLMSLGLSWRASRLQRKVRSPAGQTAPAPAVPGAPSAPAGTQPAPSGEQPAGAEK